MPGRLGLCEDIVQVDSGDVHAHKNTTALGGRVSYFAEDSMRSVLSFFVRARIHSACSTLERPSFDLERVFLNRAVLCLIN